MYRLVSNDFRRKIPSIVLQTKENFCEWKGSNRDDSFQTTYWSFHEKNFMMFPLLIFLFVFCVCVCLFFFSYGLCFYNTILCVYGNNCNARASYYSWHYSNEEYWLKSVSIIGKSACISCFIIYTILSSLITLGLYNPSYLKTNVDSSMTIICRCVSALFFYLSFMNWAVHSFRTIGKIM